MIPTSTNLRVQSGDKVPSNVEAVAVFVVEGAKSAPASGLSGEDRKAADRLIAVGVSRGKAREVHFDLIDAGKGKARRVYVVGLGEAGKLSEEKIRESAGALSKAIRKHRLKNVAVLPPNEKGVSADIAAAAVTTGLMLAAFDYREYKGTGSKKKDEDESGKPIDVTIVTRSRDAVERARVVAEGQNFARTIAFRPGNNINPPSLASVAQELAREVGLGIRVLDEKQMTKLGMGGILGVGQGSSTPPRMIVLQYIPGGVKASRARAKSNQRQQPLLVVGKSITFDTGGISIKPADKMGDMVFDKCGGMAVLGLMYAVTKLKPAIPIVGILSSAENMPGSRAYRPGDILRMYNGVTVEVTNTDAEGRLVLGDALAWGIETFKPSAVVDLATLTGGVVTALGTSMAGVICNDDKLFNELQRASDKTGEKMWRLPISDDVRERIKSHTADIVNSAGRAVGASPLQGSEFLRYFVPEGTPWAHFDIAGVADTERDLPYYSKGATGWGVRTLVEWIESRTR